MNTLFTALSACAIAFGALALWLVLRARPAPLKVDLGGPAPAPPASLWRNWPQAAWNYLRRLLALLTTPTAERYRQPWLLVLGEQRSGKSSLLASLTWVQEHSDAQAVARPGLPLTAWHTLPQGLLIDPDGKLSTAAADSALAAQWRQALDSINALRPQRALDGVLMLVSARSLLALEPAQRLVLAQDAQRQLHTLHSRLRLALPVYLVLSHCDAIEGFGAFWRAFPSHLHAQMHGWSAPGGVAQARPTEWLDSAFNELGARLKDLQVEAAALSPPINEADSFFLYPRHFEQLRQPLREYLTEVFSESAWGPAFLCRGIYCSGVVQATGTPTPEPRRDVAFVDELLEHKVLKERGLARVVRPTIWSRDPALRLLQRAGIALALGLTLALGLAAWHLDEKVSTLNQALRHLPAASPLAPGGSACLAKPVLDEALTRAALVDPSLSFAALPLSWFDQRASRRAVQAVAQQVLAASVFPALACALQQRADQFAAALPQPTPKAESGAKSYTYGRSLARLQTQAQAVQELELNLRRFEQLKSQGGEHHAQRIDQLNQLSLYLYASPLPTPVLAEQGAVAQALAAMPSGIATPGLSRQREAMVRQLAVQPAQLHTALRAQVAAGPALLSGLAPNAPTLTESARDFSAWLTWINREWLPANPQNNPCTSDARTLDQLLRPLVESYGYPASLLKDLPLFGDASCYQPALQVLRSTQLSPYGPLTLTQGTSLVLNPALSTELRGFSALLGQSFMQSTKPLAFDCIKSAPGWRTVDLGRAEAYARAYQEFTAAQQLAPLGVPLVRSPLYLRVATDQLERVMNDALLAAQSSAGAPVILVGAGAVSPADQQMLAQSNDFSGTVQPLLSTLRLYTQLGFASSGAKVTQCARDFASSALGRVAALAEHSRLYEPDPGPAKGPLLNLGATPVLRDYLSGQLARAKVLSDYAAPFASLLQATDITITAPTAPNQSPRYWTNTANLWGNYVQAYDQAGQVGHLESLLLKTAPGLTNTNCAQQLVAYTAADYDNDLFSSRRQALMSRLGDLCGNRQATLGADAYQRLAKRFNSDLAGRYPFAPLQADDLALGVAKAFFIDYDQQRETLTQQLAALDRSSWQAPLDFIAKLDQAAAFLRGSLTATPASQPLRMSVTFRVRPSAAAGSGTHATPGSNQLDGWSLSAGSRMINYPSVTPPLLDWPFGQALELNLNWAEIADWHPISPSTPNGLTVDGTNVSYSGGGEWALLRMMERFTPRMVPAVEPLNPNRVLLELAVPVVRNGTLPASTATNQALLYLGLNLSAVEAKTQTVTTLTWPGSFPSKAPPAPLKTPPAQAMPTPAQASPVKATRAPTPVSPMSPR